jgi:hypothetical protein
MSETQMEDDLECKNTTKNKAKNVGGYPVASAEIVSVE